MPAVALWTLLGLIVNLVPLNWFALVVGGTYAAYYGLIETTARPGLPPPGRRWQVPATWVKNTPKWRRVLVWGSLLGPGFATRNPYAGFGLLPLVLASIGNIRIGVVVAATIGLLHGTARALALLRDTRGISSADYMQAVMKSLRWRTFDGFALLTFTGVTAVIVARGI
jgi:hypothetical protein